MFESMRERERERERILNRMKTLQRPNVCFLEKNLLQSDREHCPVSALFVVRRQKQEGQNMLFLSSP